ncbi:apolipoprotein(A) [Trichonephila clavipes]|nr:apolipoprotein(A) [Trichonephila clavipes]
MGVQKLDWPFQSPDLNPIEHLWDELERRLRRQPNQPSSLQALTSAVMDAWKAIPMVVSPSIVISGNFAELIRTVTCTVLKGNDRRTSSPCYDEFRGPRSDYVRQGDSGGPLACKFGDRWYLMGDTSYATQGNFMGGLCAMPWNKVMFSKVSDKVDWIRTMIQTYT